MITQTITLVTVSVIKSQTCLWSPAVARLNLATQVFPRRNHMLCGNLAYFRRWGGAMRRREREWGGCGPIRTSTKHFFFNSGLSRLRFFRAAPPRKLHIPCRGCSSAWFHLRHQGQLLRRASSNARCRQGELLLSDVLSESNLRWNAFIIVWFFCFAGEPVWPGCSRRHWAKLGARCWVSLDCCINLSALQCSSTSHLPFLAPSSSPLSLSSSLSQSALVYVVMQRLEEKELEDCQR